mgnify:CR=1 FL=1
MKIKRTTISLNPIIVSKAQAVMRARAFTDFSGFIAQLIREEHERREGPDLIEHNGKAKK